MAKAMLRNRERRAEPKSRVHGAEATDQPRASKSGEEESSLNRGSREPGKSGGNDPDSPQPHLGGPKQRLSFE